MSYRDAPRLSDDELGSVSGGTTPGVVGTVFVGALDDAGEAVATADSYGGHLRASAADSDPHDGDAGADYSVVASDD